MTAACCAQETGTAARLGMGARPLALSGAFVAIPDDPTSVFWNPAGLATVRGTRLQLHYRRVSASHAMDSGNVVFAPARYRMVWGVSLQVLHRTGIAADDALGSFPGEPGATEFSGQVTMGFRAHPNLSLGIAAGPIISSLDARRGDATGWGGNAGLLWRQAGTSIGLGILGVTMGLGSDATPQPYRYRLSAGVAQSLGDPLLVAVQMDRDRGGDPMLASGLEWALVPGLHLRAGVRQPLAQVGGGRLFSNGYGVQHGRLQVDYAVRFASELSPEHLLTLQFRLGSDAAPRSPQATMAVQANDDIADNSADGLPAPPRPQASTPLPTSKARPVQYVVRGGVHSSMDPAALEVARFYRAQIRPTLEKRGELFLVVIKRCSTRAEAQEWQVRARDAGLQCSIDEE
jgi:hypothetical protein